MVSHGNHGRVLVIGSRAVSALFTKFGLAMGLFSFLVVLASLLVGGEVPPSVLWCTRLEVPDPIFTVGLSPDKFDNGYEGLNTALPFPDVSSLRVSGMMVLYPCSVAQSVKSFVLLADVMEATWVFQSNNVSGVGHCPCQPPFSQKDFDLIDGVMLLGRDNCSLSRSCSLLGPGFSDSFHTEHFLFAGQGKEKKPGSGAKDTSSSSRNCSFPQATGYALILGALRNDSVEGASAIDVDWTQKRAVAVTLVTSAAASFATVGLLTLLSVRYVLVSILGVPANVKFLVLPFVLVGSFVLLLAALVGDFKV